MVLIKSLDTKNKIIPTGITPVGLSFFIRIRGNKLEHKEL